MKRRYSPAPDRVRNDVDAALATMGADALRELVREMLLDLDDRAHSRVVNSLINRAARSGSGWAPAALGDDDVAEVFAFAKAAERRGQADPTEVDEHLRRGSAAFLRKDYTAAHRIFGALLGPVGEGEIDLGQHEMVDEVLGVDTGECAAQYVVSAYMLAAAAERADAVRAAIDEVSGVGHFWEPIREMERVAVEPLPLLDDFLPRWRALIGRRPAGERDSDWDTDEDRWLREVVRRIEGADGLAKVARSTKRADDLRAWCKSLVEAGDWDAALLAFDEAAEIVTDKEYARGEFLDGAALAAQQMDRNDLPARLERAWRAAPSMLRVRRWLGSAISKAAIQKRAAEALDACPKEASRQRAFLHVLQGDFEPAAKLLATAPGLGWSNGEHPGHLLFPLFEAFFGAKKASASPRVEQLARRGMDIGELELMTADEEAPHLAAPEVGDILRQAGIDAIPDPAARVATLAAMREAAERRLAGVTEQKRRRHYGHAAELVATCLACDRSPEVGRWVASIKTEYRRFPALRAELDRALRSP
jgi:tetratricopeptide (TPR) repeat protein